MLLIKNIVAVSVAGLLTLLLSCSGPGSDIPGTNSPSATKEVLSEIEAISIHPRRTFGIVLTAFNRPGYLARTLDSLRKTHSEDLKKSVLVITDDASTDLETLSLLKEFELEGALVFKLRHAKNSGVLTGLMHGFKMLNESVDYLVNIDADINVKPGWLSSLKETFERIGDKKIILTGFNTKNHGTLQEYQFFVEKESIGGINFFMKSEFYREYFSPWFSGRDRLDSFIWRSWDWFVVSKMRENGFKFYATRPSVIQHIGFQGGLHSNDKNMDVAEDYE